MKPIVIDSSGMKENPTLLGWELVEEKAVAASSSSVTFSNLDGNATGEYMIEFALDFATGSSNRTLHVQPNNDSSTNRRTAVVYRDNGGGSSLTSNYFYLGQTIANAANCQVFGKMQIFAKTGFVRIGIGEFWAYVSSSSYLAGFIGTEWGDTSNNITSLVITITGGTMGGTGNFIRLYKKV